MFPRKNTHISRWFLLLAILVCISTSVAAEVTESDLSAARDSYSQVWKMAAEKSTQLSVLESRLATFDSKVEAAKQKLAQSEQDQKDVAQQIASKEELAQALSGQLLAVRASQEYYDGLVETEQHDFVGFARYIASRNIAVDETGPSIGGVLLRHLLRGSLGDAVEDALARTATLQVRAQYFRQLTDLARASKQAGERLKIVATALADELTTLEEHEAELTADVNLHRAAIDTSWRNRKLTEDELAAVQRDIAESNAQMDAVQQNLQQVHGQLQEKKFASIRAAQATLEATQQSLRAELAALERKDAAMRIVEEAAVKAFQATVHSQNTDVKLYQKIEQRKLKITNEQNALASLEAGVPDGGSPPPEALKLKDTIASEQAVLALMQQGVTEDAAVAYLEAKHQAANATELRVGIAEDIVKLKRDLAQVLVAISKKVSELEAAQREGTDGGVVVFQWPVRGPITAGYLDPVYEAVFHVPHRAIDIAVSQNTPVRCVRDGIVYALKNGGAKGYSYILVGHDNGYASLYGHVSKFLVNVGDVVAGGEVIALSGGTPGTPGAGYMTTGPHVHLEMTKDGAHFDPRTVLGK